MQVLIIATFIAMKQMQIFKHMDMGFNKEAVINVEVPETSSDKLETFENDILSHSNIRKVSFSSSLPSGLKRAKWIWEIRRKSTISEEVLIFEYQSVDYNYLDLYDIKLLAGKGFAENNNPSEIIINQTLSSKLGFSSPEEAINSEVIVRNEPITIIGVIEDIYSNSFKNELDKVGLMVASDQFKLASIKLHTLAEASSDYEGLEASLAHIEQIWNSHFEKSVFTYSFLDDNVQAFYEEEARITNLFRIFSFVFSHYWLPRFIWISLFHSQQKKQGSGGKKSSGSLYKSDTFAVFKRLHQTNRLSISHCRTDSLLFYVRMVKWVCLSDYTALVVFCGSWGVCSIHRFSLGK